MFRCTVSVFASCMSIAIHEMSPCPLEPVNRQTSRGRQRRLSSTTQGPCALAVGHKQNVIGLQDLVLRLTVENLPQVERHLLMTTWGRWIRRDHHCLVAPGRGFQVFVKGNRL